MTLISPTNALLARHLELLVIFFLINLHVGINCDSQSTIVHKYSMQTEEVFSLDNVVYIHPHDYNNGY